ncbi:MAG TPA: hypothetical protein VK475_01585 [Pyrinomonadaceae bacterium]|nr:hypothetical protein [Pyrinomonadaceae bacterium]
MPNLTLADVLHNLPYSLDGHSWILDLNFRNWDRMSPLLGLLNLINGVLWVEIIKAASAKPALKKTLFGVRRAALLQWARIGLEEEREHGG